MLGTLEFVIVGLDAVFECGCGGGEFLSLGFLLPLLRRGDE